MVGRVQGHVQMSILGIHQRLIRGWRLLPSKAGLCWRRFGAKTGVKGLIVSNHNLFLSRCSPRDCGS